MLYLKRFFAPLFGHLNCSVACVQLLTFFFWVVSPLCGLCLGLRLFPLCLISVTVLCNTMCDFLRMCALCSRVRGTSHALRILVGRILSNQKFVEQPDLKGHLSPNCCLHFCFKGRAVLLCCRCKHFDVSWQNNLSMKFVQRNPL